MNDTATAAVILAAGRGSRMLGLTAERPKCLVELAGRPLLHWQLGALRAAGIRRILVVRGYAAQSLQGDFATVENPRWAETNMVSSLLCADGFACRFFASGGERLVVSYSDIVYHPGHVRRLLAASRDMAITYDTEWEALWKLRFEDVLSDAETFRQEGGLLREIGGRPSSLAEIHGQYMGLLCFSKAGWATLEAVFAGLGPEAVDKLDMTGLLRLLLAQGTAIEAVPVAGRWCEADSGTDLKNYENALARGNWSHDWRAEKNKGTAMKHGDFTSLAANYAQYRPGYSPFVLDAFCGLAREAKGKTCADVGAGTGICARLLAERGLHVIAVEPNDAMREEGEKANGTLDISWRKGSAEHTGLGTASVDMACMASSFHWPDFDLAVREFHRILRPGGLFMALWNTRRYESNPLLVEIENQLHTLVPELRRVSSGRSEFCGTLTERLKERCEFEDVLYLEGRHTENQSPERYIGLWESVNDVRVQAGEERFRRFLDFIRERTADVPVIEAEYLTRAWIARRKD